jgi:hypothetical protein
MDAGERVYRLDTDPAPRPASSKGRHNYVIDQGAVSAVFSKGQCSAGGGGDEHRRLGNPSCPRCSTTSRLYRLGAACIISRSSREQ